jgi:hypothetical protein
VLGGVAATEERGLALRDVDPHAALAVGALVVLVAEVAHVELGSDVWVLVEAAAALVALVVAWRAQERIRLRPLLALALAFHAGWIALHLGLHVAGDFDSRSVYRREGDTLLDGRYPRSEYPVGAVLLFAFESWISGGATRTANALLMIPFQLATVAAVWACRTRRSAWLAAVLAFWPLDAFYWEFKFDLVAASLLAVGLVLALRRRWTLAGAALGLGAVVKWTPALAFATLAVWLGASREWRPLGRLALAFAATVAFFYVPFLAWSPSEVLAAYTRQGGRSITAESIWYLPLHASGLAHLRGHVSFRAGAPHWADVLAVCVQLALVLITIVTAVLVRRQPRPAVAVAAVAPAVFLLTNRVFSPQFMVVILAAWTLAASLVTRSRREQFAVAFAAGAATLANAFVYPYALPHYAVLWQVASATLFAFSLAATAWLVGIVVTRY